MPPLKGYPYPPHRRSRMSTTVSLLITYLKPQRGKAVVLAALVLTGIGLQLGAPRLMQSLIDASRAGT